MPKEWEDMVTKYMEKYGITREEAIKKINEEKAKRNPKKMALGKMAKTKKMKGGRY